MNVANVKVLPVSHWQFPIRAAWQVAGGVLRKGPRDPCAKGRLT